MTKGDGRYVGRDWDRRDERGRPIWTIWGPYYRDRWESGERGIPYAKSGRYHSREAARKALRELRRWEARIDSYNHRTCDAGYGVQGRAEWRPADEARDASHHAWTRIYWG